jgi:integrase/recombinase XerD
VDDDTQGAARARSSEEHLAALKDAMQRRGYRPLVVESYLRHAGRFLTHLGKRELSVAGEEDVRAFLAQALGSYKHRHQHPPPALGSWRGSRTGAIRMLLRTSGTCRGRVTLLGSQAHAEILDAYRVWLSGLRSLAPLSVAKYCRVARVFLAWLETRAPDADALHRLSVADIDAYLEARAPGLKRVSRKTLGGILRSFMKYLHAEHVIAHDLAGAVWSTRVYEYERPPCGLNDTEIKQVLATTSKDQTPVGRRDYAMLMLLATYGLRASEVVQLLLEDLDWRHERLRVRHSKRGPASDLPLVASAGEALLAYLSKGRPPTTLREVFVRAKAPYDRPLRGDGLYQVVCRRLQLAGVQPEGKHGPHAFRHGRAVALLRAGVSLKSIGDILGHRRPSSTQAYLRLQTEDLRDVALPVPGSTRE